MKDFVGLGLPDTTENGFGNGLDDEAGRANVVGEPGETSTGRVGDTVKRPMGDLEAGGAGKAGTADDEGTKDGGVNTLLCVPAFRPYGLDAGRGRTNEEAGG